MTSESSWTVFVVAVLFNRHVQGSECHYSQTCCGRLPLNVILSINVQIVHEGFMTFCYNHSVNVRMFYKLKQCAWNELCIKLSNYRDHWNVSSRFWWTFFRMNTGLWVTHKFQDQPSVCSKWWVFLVTNHQQNTRKCEKNSWTHPYGTITKQSMSSFTWLEPVMESDKRTSWKTQMCTALLQRLSPSS